MTASVHRLVAIGGSWGGIVALRSILSTLALGPDTAAAVVLHRRPVDSELAQVLGRGSAVSVEEAEDKTPLIPGKVYIAPPDYHLLVERGWLALSTEASVKFSRPSIDVLLESAAASYGARTVAVVLTGASDDGTDGARAVIRHGGKVIVQDPATAEQPTMPRSVLDAGIPSTVATLEDLPTAISGALGGRPGAGGTS